MGAGCEHSDRRSFDPARLITMFDPVLEDHGHSALLDRLEDNVVDHFRRQSDSVGHVRSKLNTKNP
jgi:hypothetical protein